MHRRVGKSLNPDGPADIVASQQLAARLGNLHNRTMARRPE